MVCFFQSSLGCQGELLFFYAEADPGKIQGTKKLQSRACWLSQAGRVGQVVLSTAGRGCAYIGECMYGTILWLSTMTLTLSITG